MSADHKIINIQLHRPTDDDVFVALTGLSEEVDIEKCAKIHRLKKKSVIGESLSRNSLPC